MTTIEAPFIFQWGGLAIASLVPTIALVGVIVRLGSFVQIVKGLKEEVDHMATAIESLRLVAMELQAWRDASKLNQEDLLARVRRLEDLELNRR